MSSVRAQIWIDQPAGKVWDLVGDSRRIPEWFPGVERCEVDGDTRTCHLRDGRALVEQVVTQDNEAYRIQYRVSSGLPVTHHLGTIDVIADGDDRCAVVYGTDVEPESFAKPLLRSMSLSLDGLADRSW